MTDTEEKDHVEEAIDELKGGSDKAEDPSVKQEEEITAIREQITAMHNTIDNIKKSSENIANELNYKIQDIDDPELEKEYKMLANSAYSAYNRIERGDSNMVRGGL